MERAGLDRVEEAGRASPWTMRANAAAIQG
jgi:hypothetical protein